MSKKTLIIISVSLIVLIACVAGYFVMSSGLSGRLERSTSLIPKALKEEEIKADVLFEDTAGFSFKHPKEVKVTDITPTEDDYYTKLNLTRGSEKIVVTVKDTSAKNADDWLKSDSTYLGASLVGATTLGGISAKQYSKAETLITVAVDQGVIYLIEGQKDAGFWEDVQSAFVLTFKFAATENSSSASSSASDIEYEVEEVIE